MDKQKIIEQLDDYITQDKLNGILEMQKNNNDLLADIFVQNESRIIVLNTLHEKLDTLMNKYEIISSIMPVLDAYFEHLGES
jgi:flagellar motor component MotA|tara:strand:- start:1879 stop:2124 length:246 start_codon:yes stop_codon:yes gene_type:complete